MGLELALLPLGAFDTNTVTGKPWGFSHEIIQVGKQYDLFDDIQKLSPTPLPEGHDVSSYIGATIKDGYYKGEHTYGALEKTPYGEPYTYVRGADLVPLMQKHIPDHPATAYMIAAVKRRADLLVVLGWH